MLGAARHVAEGELGEGTRLGAAPQPARHRRHPRDDGAELVGAELADERVEVGHRLDRRRRRRRRRPVAAEAAADTTRATAASHSSDSVDSDRLDCVRVALRSSSSGSPSSTTDSSESRLPRRFLNEASSEPGDTDSGESPELWEGDAASAASAAGGVGSAAASAPDAAAASASVGSAPGFEQPPSFDEQKESAGAVASDAATSFARGSGAAAAGSVEAICSTTAQSSAGMPPNAAADEFEIDAQTSPTTKRKAHNPLQSAACVGHHWVHKRAAS